MSNELSIKYDALDWLLVISVVLFVVLVTIGSILTAFGRVAAPEQDTQHCICERCGALLDSDNHQNCKEER